MSLVAEVTAFNSKINSGKENFWNIFSLRKNSCKSFEDEREHLLHDTYVGNVCKISQSSSAFM